MKKLKKILIIFVLINIFMLDDCYADLTFTQQENIKNFTVNFVEKGLNKKDSNGYPLFAYMQGQARIDGYQGKLYYVSKDYQKLNNVNAPKWTFDCASFVSYIYKNVFDLVLTKSTTSKIDSYSGLKLMSETANPYTVSDFVSNADENKHFYYIQKKVTVETINYDIMKPGDLIIIKGSHIMMYIGDKKIAHASSSSINQDKKLGIEIKELAEKYPERTFYVIRVKNNIINPKNTGNTSVIWPDTNINENLVINNKPTAEIDIKEYDAYAELNITLSDDKGLLGYQITTNSTIPTTWNDINEQRTFIIKHTIKENNTYYLYVKDTENEISCEKIVIEVIDDKVPIINDVKYKYNLDETFDITILATDDNEILYSIDGINYQQSNVFTKLKKGSYNLYVKDKYNNLTTQTINLQNESIPKFIINYNQEYTKSLVIKITMSSEDGIKGYKITNDSIAPKYYDNYTGEIDYTINNNGIYYIWAFTNNNIPYAQTITINNIDNTPPVIEKVNIDNKILFGTSIEIIANDIESGVIGYSIDGINYQEDNIFKKINRDITTVYVKDKCNNIVTYQLKYVHQDTNIIILIPIIILVSIIICVSIKRKIK